MESVGDDILLNTFELTVEDDELWKIDVLLHFKSTVASAFETTFVTENNKEILQDSARPPWTQEPLIQCLFG